MSEETENKETEELEGGTSSDPESPAEEELTEAAEPVRVDLLDRETWTLGEILEAKKAVFANLRTRREFERQWKDLTADDPLRRGTAAWVLGRNREAAGLLAKVREPEAHVQYLLARSLTEIRRYDEALEIFRGLVRRKEAPYHLGLLDLLQAMGDADGLAKELERVKGRIDDLGLLAAYEGWLLELAGDYQGAAALYEKGLQAHPDDVRPLFRLAFLHDRQGNDEEAIELYRRCLTQSPAPVNAAINLGVLLEDHEKYHEAIECYRWVLEYYPNHRRARLFLKDATASLTMYIDEDQERREDKRNQILQIPVTDFELSVRSRNCLAKMNIVTLGDLIKKSEGELLAYKNFGETSLAEIKDILTSKGLRLGMERDEEIDEEAMIEPSTKVADDILNKSVAEVEFSIRSRRAMERLEVKTLGDLIQRTAAELLACPNFGQTSLTEVTQKLAEFGLTLKPGK